MNVIDNSGMVRIIIQYAEYHDECFVASLSVIFELSQIVSHLELINCYHNKNIIILHYRFLPSMVSLSRESIDKYC